MALEETMLHDIDEADRLVRASCELEQIPGAVLQIGHGDTVDFCRAYGFAQVVPERIPMREDTLFDLASLTKVTAVLPQVLLLLEEGKLTLSDTLEELLLQRALRADMRGITVLQLLTHTAGLVPFADTQGRTRTERIQSLLDQPLSFLPGQQCVYSDLSFILLGEIVAALRQTHLAQAAGKVLMALGMRDTMYCPPAGRAFAATEVINGQALAPGVVHDERARQLDGVAGHAGLFSTAADMGRFCAAFLSVPRHPLLRGEWVDKSFMSHSAAAPERGLGWMLFGLGAQGKVVGHTGFTGTSIHLCPRSGAYCVLLTNRVHPSRENAHIMPLRRGVAQAVFGLPEA